MSVLTAVPAAIEAAPAVAPLPMRIMVVDDSAVVRGLVTRWLEEEQGFKVVASLRNGREAVDHFERVNPDVVILDVEMPELDGLSALPLLLQKKRDLVVLMVSTVTRRNAEVSFKALSLGAADYITKPESNRGITTSLDFRRALVEKVRSLGQRRLRRGAVPPAPSPLLLRPQLEPPLAVPRSQARDRGCRHDGAARTGRHQAPPLADLAAARAVDCRLDRRAPGADSS